MTKSSKAESGSDAKVVTLKSASEGWRGRDRKRLPSALDMVFESDDAFDGFLRLQAWLQQAGEMSYEACEVEEELFTGGMELLRQMLQQHFNERGPGDVGAALESCDEQGQLVRLSHRRLHERRYESLFGTVFIIRQAYGAVAQSSIHPLDSQLNLPARSFSYALQKRAARACARGPFDEAKHQIQSTTAAKLEKRQLQQLATEAAASFDDFYETRPVLELGSQMLLIAGVDCKGVPRRRSAEEKVEPLPKHLSKGQKRQKKKMAIVASVHQRARHVRTPEEVVASLMDARQADEAVAHRREPKVHNRRLWARLKQSKDTFFEDVAAEMKRRDAQNRQQAVLVIDGEKALALRAESHLRKACPNLVVILDILHVLSYLWRAAYVFCQEGSEEARLWVRKRLLAILQGKGVSVVAGIRQSASKHALDESEREALQKACKYLLNHKHMMRYDTYLAAGLPIASGSVEGACGHLVKDRMELTGASWKVHDDTAEAILKLRALDKSGDLDDYWTFHTQRQRQSLYDRPWRLAS